MAVAVAYVTGLWVYEAAGGTGGGIGAGIVAGAAAGAAYSATVTVLHGGSIGDVFKNALIGGVLGGIAGWANAMSSPVVGGIVGGGLTTGTPGGSPPMTPPAGAVSLTSPIQEAWASIKDFFFGPSSTPSQIIFLDPTQDTEKSRSRVQEAWNAAYGALAGADGRLPGNVTSVLVRVAEGGSGWERGESIYNEPSLNMSTIKIHNADVLTVDQSVLNSIMLHELMHTIQDSTLGIFEKLGLVA